MARDRKLDLVTWGTTSSYNQVIDREKVNLVKLPHDRLMFIIGNNMNIWPIIEKLKNEGNLNPFDNYARTVASEIAS